MSEWVLFTYRLPREPSALRVRIWRKLQHVGALLIHDSIWVLPATAACCEHFQWLGAEVKEMGGEAMVWEVDNALEFGGDSVRKRFEKRTDGEYQRLLKRLRTTKPDRAAIAAQFRLTRAKDYFDSRIGTEMRELLMQVEPAISIRKTKRRRNGARS